MKYCPRCTRQLVENKFEDKNRLCCPDSNCGFVFWNNPLPVVAGLVETSQGIILAHNIAWPPAMYSVITGFLEAREAPGQAIIRETHEELGLHGHSVTIIGAYPFYDMNQVIVAYHLFAEGTIKLNHELDDYKIVAKDQLDAIPFGIFRLTKHIITDWLVN